MSSDFLNKFFYQSSVQETETTVGIFKHEDISDRKLCAYYITKAEEQSLSWVSWNSSHTCTELTNSRSTTSEATPGNIPETRVSALPTQPSTQKVGKCALGAAVHGGHSR